MTDAPRRRRAHHHAERTHQGIGNEIITPEPAADAGGDIVERERLGGLTATKTSHSCSARPAENGTGLALSDHHRDLNSHVAGLTLVSTRARLGLVLGHYGRKSCGDRAIQSSDRPRAEDVHVDPVVTRTISASAGSGDGLGTGLLIRNHLWQGGCDGSLLIQLGRAAQNVHRILVTEDGQKIGFTSPMHILKPLAAKAD